MTMQFWVVWIIMTVCTLKIPRLTIPSTEFDSSSNPPFNFDTTLNSATLIPTSDTGIFRARVTWDTFVACWLLLEWPDLTECTRSRPLSYEAISSRGTCKGWDAVVVVLALGLAAWGMLTESEVSLYSDKLIQAADWDFIYKMWSELQIKSCWQYRCSHDVQYSLYLDYPAWQLIIQKTLGGCIIISIESHNQSVVQLCGKSETASLESSHEKKWLLHMHGCSVHE